MQTSALALEKLYHEYNGLLYGFSYSILRSHALAEEVVQETFLRAIRALDLSREAASVKSWLFTTARNLSIDVLRREGHSVGEEPLFFVPSQDEERMEQQAFLNELFRSLDEADCELLMLSAAGFRQREIAEKLGMPLGTVSWRFSELRKKLRHYASEKEKTK